MKSIKQCESLQVGDPTGTPQLAAPQPPLPPPPPPICSHFMETVGRLRGTHSPFRQDFDPQPAGERVAAKVTVLHPSSPFPLPHTYTCYIIYFFSATLVCCFSHSNTVELQQAYPQYNVGLNINFCVRCPQLPRIPSPMSKLKKGKENIMKKEPWCVSFENGSMYEKGAHSSCGSMMHLSSVCVFSFFSYVFWGELGLGGWHRVINTLSVLNRVGSSGLCLK